MRLLFAVLFVIAFAASAPAQVSSAFDLIIANGRVVDPESGLNAVRHIGIKAGKIVNLSESPLTGAPMLQAAGLVVAPGFIDLHSHALTVPSMRMQAFDGVTTALELEVGSLPVGRAYDLIARDGGRPINYGYSVSWILARMKVLDGAALTGSPASYGANLAKPNWSRPASAERVVDIMMEIENGLHEGSIGIGIMAGYAPQSGEDEFVELHRLAARHGVPTFTHTRTFGVKGFEEVIAAGKATGAHVHLCHINSMSLRQIAKVTEIIAKAQRDGVRVTTEAYPYGASSTTIGAPFLSPEAISRSGQRPTNIFVVDTARWVRDAEDLARIRRERPSANVIIQHLSEDVATDRALIEAAVLFADTAIVSDAMPYLAAGRLVNKDAWPLPDNAIAHPRVAGSFSRVLGSWVRDRKVISLNEAIRRASLIPARILEDAIPQMRDKGRIRVGADADIVVFDADTIADRATYQNPRIHSVGMRHVIVNGVALIQNGELDRHAMSGRAVRGPIR